MSSALSTGTLVSALLAGAWVRSVAWPRAALVALAGLTIANALCLFFHDFRSFVLLQSVAGFCGGSVGCLAMTVLSDHADPAKRFGLAMAVQVAYQVAGLVVGPTLLRLGGLNGVLTMLVAVSALSMLLVPLLPRRGRTVLTEGIPAALRKPPVLLALFGCMAFFFNVGAYWTYIQPIGTQHELTSQVVADSIAGGVSAGIPGGLLAVALGYRLGRIWPLAIAAALTIVAVLLLKSPFGVVTFVVSGILYNFAWNFSLAYQLAAVSTVDATGRAVAIAGAFYNVGSACGAGLAALLVSPHRYTPVIWLVVVSISVSTLLFALSKKSRPGAAELPVPIMLVAERARDGSASL